MIRLKQPLVTAVILCFNEKKYIESTVRSILQQEVSGVLELIVVDGMSDDGTRNILQKLSSVESQVRIIDNPNRTTPSAMNIGIKASLGEYIAILSGHAVYEKDYLEQSIKILEDHPEIVCSGGPIISYGESNFGKAVAVAMSHPLGVGSAKYRYPNFEGYADGACFPVFRAKIFESIGYYDERLICNQDDEFNLRLAKSGEKVWISPKASSVYNVRETPKALFLQYFYYGFWRVAVLRKHRMPSKPRHFVPIIFFSWVILTEIIGYLLGKKVLMARIPLFCYLFFLISSGIIVVKRHSFLIGLQFMFAIFIMHFSYACGFLSGLVNGRRNWHKT